LDASASPIAKDPQGDPLELSPGTWEGQAAFVSDPVHEAGVYRVESGSDRPGVHYVVSADPTESELWPIDTDALEDLFAGIDWHRFQTRDEIADAMRHGRRQAVELWRWLVAAGLALLLFESALTLKQASTSARPAGQGQ
jgi:hypothetical protein